jgi:uncharacterized membrane protein YphA (DoxX/SURF4 family)
MTALRLALGVLWSLNLVYIFDPANRFWSTFAATAQSFEETTLGGRGFAQFVAAQPAFFAAVIAAVTLYLAVAFLLGLSTRTACLIGGAFNLALLVTQFGQISTFPGATDIGAQPLYLAMYVALFLGYDAPRFTLDRAIADTVARWRARRLAGRPAAAEGTERPATATGRMG